MSETVVSEMGGPPWWAFRFEWGPEGISRVLWPGDGTTRYPALGDEPAVVTGLRDQLRRYLEGERVSIEVSLDFDVCSAFDRGVYETVRRIPYGEVRSYGEVARDLGRPGAARAVGGSLRRNPWPLVIPCHRVVGKDGRLTGFSAPGGVDRKRELIDLERGRVAGSARR